MRGCHTSPTFTCLVVWLIRRCRIKGKHSWTQSTSSVYFSNIAKAQRRISSFAWGQEKKSIVRTWCFLKKKTQFGRLSKWKNSRSIRGKGGHIPQIGRGGILNKCQCFQARQGAQHQGRSGGQCIGHEIHS